MYTNYRLGPPEDRPGPDGRRVAGHLIRRCLRIHDMIFARLTAGSDITSPQLAALVQIAGRPGLEISVLADLIAYDVATIGGILDRLEAKALIQRTPGTVDRRKKHLVLTDEGQALLDHVLPQALRVEDELLRDLDADERALFLDLLCRVCGFSEQARDDEQVA